MVILSISLKINGIYLPIGHKRLQNYNLYVKVNKCEFPETEIKVLSFVININGIKINR